MNKSHRLLLIDDSQEILAALAKFFQKKNYEVVTASDGLNGLKLIKDDEGGFDLVITDIVMPDISGVGIIKILKEKYPKTPVVAITGWGPQPQALAVEAQADHVLEKPFDIKELERLVLALLNTTITTKQ
jgi:DNA-binding response OmpR family regulator